MPVADTETPGGDGGDEGGGGDDDGAFAGVVDVHVGRPPAESAGRLHPDINASAPTSKNAAKNVLLIARHGTSARTGEKILAENPLSCRPRPGPFVVMVKGSEIGSRTGRNS